MAKGHFNSPDNQPLRVCVGEITSAHGVKGLVKIRCDAEDETYLNGDVYTDISGDNTLHVTLKNIMKNCWLAEIDGITAREQAQALSGTKLHINRDRLPEPLPDEYYHVDLVGSLVVTEKDEPVGKVIAVNNFGAGDLLDIRPPKGQTFYLPFHKDTIHNVSEGKIIATIPEGLID